MHANRRHIRLCYLQLFYAATPHLILFLSDICFDIGVLVPSFERTLLVICMSDQTARQLEVLPPVHSSTHNITLCVLTNLLCI